MKHAIQYISASALIIFTALVFSCSDSERRMGLLGQTSSVVINLGLPADDSAANRSLIDRLRRFIARDAIAQTAPATFSLVRVRVTAVDIGVIEKEFNPYGTITMTVPSGSLRQFEVTAYVAAGDLSAATSFRGTAYANLPAGETVTVPVAMTLNETKLIIADFGNNRIAIMDQLGGIGWKTPISSSFPYDVDFDSRGRIYIAQSTGIRRIDDINGTNSLTIGNAGTYYSVSVDRINNYVYYATSNAIYRATLNGSSVLSKNPTGITSIYGIDVDKTSSDILYVVSGTTLYRYNWATGATGTILGSISTVTACYDVLSKPPYIYVANYLDNTGNQIMQYTVNSSNVFTKTANYGNRSAIATTSAGQFYGARKFVAIRNDSLILIDSGQFSTYIAKMVSLSTLNDLGWNASGTYGNSTNQFYFWAAC